MKKIFRFVKAFLLIMLFLGLIIILGVSLLNIFVRVKDKDYIISAEQAKQLTDVDCIVVLGASVYDRDTPSPMLADRLDKAIELYQGGCTDILLMSGDHGSIYYDEVDTMKGYAKKKGIPAENIFMDHAGFSTYDTMYRAKEIFGAKKIVIVTQSYHLYRAVYIARSLGLDAYGVATEEKQYKGQSIRDLREYVAIAKDVAKCIWKPEPTLLGEAVDLKGDGNVTGVGY